MNTDSDCYEYEGDEVFYTNPSTKGRYSYYVTLVKSFKVGIKYDLGKLIKGRYSYHLNLVK